VERELIRRYHATGRPMVVRMAKHRYRGNGTSLAALVEYWMLGVRLAAEPPRPSLTKKGKLVGFDPSKGYRFSTYARENGGCVLVYGTDGKIKAAEVFSASLGSLMGAH
jgi:hypothetical protein